MTINFSRPTMWYQNAHENTTVGGDYISIIYPTGDSEFYRLDTSLDDSFGWATPSWVVISYTDEGFAIDTRVIVDGLTTYKRMRIFELRHRLPKSEFVGYL
jgi:hypothetical protein